MARIGLLISSTFTVFSGSGPSDIFLLSELNGMPIGKKFSDIKDNEKVIAKSEAYFKAKEKTYYVNGMEELKKIANRCPILDGNYVE